MLPSVSGSQSNAPGARLLGPEASAEALAGELDQAVQAANEARSKEDVRLTDLHGRLWDFYCEEQRRQSANRFQMAIDEDYFDALQWDEEEILRLSERNQAALVYQAIKPMVLWVLGTEKRTRTDYRVLARRKEDDRDAQFKTKTLKYVDDVNMAQFTKSQAFKEATVSGLGWLEDGATNNPGELPLFAGQESWKNVLHDTYGNDLFGKDWRYIFRFRDVDEDIAKAMFPKAAGHLELMCSDDHKTTADEAGWYLGEKRDAADWRNPAQTYVGRRQFIDISGSTGSRRRRCRLIEAWYRVPQQCYVCKGAIFDGKVFDPKEPKMKQAYEQDAVTLVNQVQMKMRVAFMTESKILEDRESPYKHNDFPFTPVWCYRRGRDGAPYGIVRELRDPQDSLNKHMSKTQWLLASNQIMGHASAAKDWKRIRKQVDKPNGSIIFDGDRDTAAAVQINRHQGELNPHIQLAELDMRLMRENYGLNQDSLGLQSRVTAGVAIKARQEQGTIMTETIFDNLRLAQQLRGRKRLSLIEQFLVEERVVRVTGEKRGQHDYLTINRPYQDANGQWRYENDVTASQADFVIDEQDYRASIRQAMAETMAEMLTKMPGEIAFRFLDMWVELLDIPNKEEYIKRVRQLNGMGENGEPGNAEVDQVKQEAQQAIQQAQQQAQGVIEKLQREGEALAEQNRALQGTVQKQAVMLANKARELELRQDEIKMRHDEAMAKIAADRDRAQREGDIAGQQAVEKQQAAEMKRATEDKKILEEELADLQQAITEIREAVEGANKQMPVVVDAQGKVAASLESALASVGERVSKAVQDAVQLSQAAAEKSRAAEKKPEPPPPAPAKKSKKRITFNEDAKGNIIGAEIDED
jgi:hypothetical protein